MTGSVANGPEATLPLRLRVPESGVELRVIATIDTGYTEFVLLPPGIVAPLGLIVQDEVTVGLGDGGSSQMGIVEMEVEWFGAWRLISVYVSNTDPLIGASMFEGYRLCIDFVPGGEVRVEPI